jgi:hypothetical protein
LARALRQQIRDMMTTPHPTYRASRGAGTVGAVVALCLALFVPQIAGATTMLKLDTTGLSQRAALVVVGTVESVTSEVYQGQVRTAVRMAVNDTLKGMGAGQTTFYVPGGAMANGHEMVVDGMPEFTPGESACVFVGDTGWIMGGEQGKVAFAGGRVAGSGQAESLFENAVRTAAGTPLPPVAPTAPFRLFSPTTLQTVASGIQVTQASSTPPVITAITPGTVAAGVGATITITGSGFGLSRGTVSLFYRSGQPTIDVTGTLLLKTWTDSTIVCVVPVTTVNGYPSSPGSGALVVKSAGGGVSASKMLDISFGYGQYHWPKNRVGAPNTVVTYTVSPGTVTGAKAAIDAAAASWNAVNANFRFADGGTTSKSPASSPRTIGWATGIDDSYLALAYYDFNPANGEISNCYVTYNAHYTWGNGSGGSYDIQSVGAHEIGHWLNLRDLYGQPNGTDPGDTTKVMYGFSSPGTTRRTLSQGDIAGILYIYGAMPSPDKTPPVTTSDAQSTYEQTATIHLTPVDEAGGSGVAATWASLDGASALRRNVVTTSIAGPHSLVFWSVDNAGNTEGARTATFSVTTEKAPPVTVSDAKASYAGVATIHLTATDNIGSGVWATYALLDGGALATTTAVTISAVGTHTLEFWSVDNVGNTEAHNAVTFTITPGQAQIAQVLTTPVAPASVRHRVSFTVYGFLQPHFAAGTHVTLKFYYRKDPHHAWAYRTSVTTHVFDSSGASKYSVRVSVPDVGEWRVRAYRPFPIGSSFSSFRSFKART